MKSGMVYALVMMVTMLSQALPAIAGEPGLDESGIATFEGRFLDLADGWGQAEACVVWDNDRAVECFRSEGELLEHIATTEQLMSRTSEVTAAGSSSCSSSLKLYDGTSYTGSALYLYQRTSWINLANYGWSNRTSSFKVGACLSYFADDSNGGGNWYPSALTQAYSQSSTMVSGWNNRISSVYLG